MFNSQGHVSYMPSSSPLQDNRECYVFAFAVYLFQKLYLLMQQREITLGDLSLITAGISDQRQAMGYASELNILQDVK